MTDPDAVPVASAALTGAASAAGGPSLEGGPRRRPAWAIVGALVMLVLGLAMLVPAVHLATQPILLPSATGPAFDCGTALKPPTQPFPVKVCGAEPRRVQQQALAWGMAAGIIGAGGMLAFLVPTRVRGARHSRRRTPDPLDTEDF